MSGNRPFGPGGKQVSGKRVTRSIAHFMSAPKPEPTTLHGDEFNEQPCSGTHVIRVFCQGLVAARLHFTFARFASTLRVVLSCAPHKLQASSIAPKS